MFTTIDELKKIAFQIDGEYTVFWPHLQTKETIILNIDSDLEYGYKTNNSVIAFVNEEILYVIPYHIKIMNLLDDSGYIQIDMHVPFSNHEYPYIQKEKEYWDFLKKLTNNL